MKCMETHQAFPAAVVAVERARKSTMLSTVVLAVLFGASLISASITEPAVSPTPPMGFNNWARFMCDLNETLFVQTADAMAQTGLLDAGYDRLNLDDCWMQYSRAPNGSLQWNTTLFPRGIPWLAEHVKSQGFKLGIYEDSGNQTCGGYPGSLGYEELDVQTFSSWGIDYLKVDGCNVDPYSNKTLQETYRQLYGLWHKVLSELPEPLVFSESAPAYFSGDSDFSNQTNKSDWYRVMDWVPLYGELARHSNDIAVYGLYEPHEYWESIMTNYGFQILLARYQRPGFYNDPDFLIPDWPWLTLDEKMSHFALWASFSAPLIISAFIPDLGEDEIAYLTNEDIIAVDQDPLGLQATLVSQDGTWDVLTKSLSNGDRLLTVLNRGNRTASTVIEVERIGLPSDRSYSATDLWTGSDFEITDNIKVTLNRHATAIYRLSDVSWITPTGMIFNSASMQCLTASDSSVKFARCAATDSQVWRVSPQGMISPLSAPSMCLSDVGGNAALQHCKHERRNQGWAYHISGNLINKASLKCVTEDGGATSLATCGDQVDSQVFGLPSGVEIVRHDRLPYWAGPRPAFDGAELHPQLGEAWRVEDR